MHLDKAKTTFFANVSHEFRTPLTLIEGPLLDVLNDKRCPVLIAHRHQLTIVWRNTERLLKLVNSLLDFSRIESQASFVPVDLAKLTTDFASSFRSTIENGGLRYVVECERLGEPVYVDVDMWEKIVLNLLSTHSSLPCRAASTFPCGASTGGPRRPPRAAVTRPSITDPRRCVGHNRHGLRHPARAHPPAV